MCFQPPGAPSCCAPTEREPNSVTSSYKHLAPLGRNPTASTCGTSNLNSRMTNGKSFCLLLPDFKYLGCSEVPARNRAMHSTDMSNTNRFTCEVNCIVDRTP